MARYRLLGRRVCLSEDDAKTLTYQPTWPKHLVSPRAAIGVPSLGEKNDTLECAVQVCSRDLDRGLEIIEERTVIPSIIDKTCSSTV